MGSETGRRRVSRPAQEASSSRAGGSTGASAFGRRWRVRRRGFGGRQNPAVGYSHPLDEATDCDGVPSSTTSFSSSFSFSYSSTIVVPFSPFLFTTSSSSSAYFESIEQFLLTWNSGLLRSLPEWYVLPSSLLWWDLERVEFRAFCSNGSISSEIFQCGTRIENFINFQQ